eukprot:424674_1
MSACIHWFAVFISIMELSYSEYLVYYNAFERANESTTFTTTTNTDGVWVDGYKGHYGSLSTINSSTYCVCDGAYSCAIASSITADADCEGSLSCFQVSNLNGIYHDGSGVNSIAYTSIRAGSGDVHCRGEQSCAFSNIKEFAEIYAPGAYSLLNATMDTINTIVPAYTPISIFLMGYYSGFEASITCRVGHVCFIYCGVASACTNLHLNCYGNCSIISGEVNTDSSALGDILLYDSLHLEQENDALCTVISVMNFDNAYDSFTAVLNDSYGGPICCRGDSSCDDLTIEYSSHMNETIVCSGGGSCRDNKIANINGLVFCGGLGSCSQSNIMADKIYCAAENSCYTSNITKTSYVYCSGYYSCKGANICSNGTDLNLYLTARQTIYYAITAMCSESDHCNIYCLGYQSCSNLHLFCDGTCNVDCDDNSGCPVYLNTTTSSAPTVNPVTSMPSSTILNATPPPVMPSSQPAYSSGEVIESTQMSTEAMSTSTLSPEPDTTSFWIKLLFAIILLFLVLAVVIMRIYKRKQDTLIDKQNMNRSVSLMNNAVDVVGNNVNVNVELQQQRQRVYSKSQHEDNNVNKMVNKKDEIDENEGETAPPNAEIEEVEGVLSAVISHDARIDTANHPHQQSISSGNSDDIYSDRVAKHKSNSSNSDDVYGSRTTTRCIDQHALFKQWLAQKVRLPQYHDLLVQNGFETLELIMEISDIEELKIIGISKSGHVLKFHKEIQRLKETLNNTNK